MQQDQPQHESKQCVGGDLGGNCVGPERKRCEMDHTHETKQGAHPALDRGLGHSQVQATSPTPNVMSPDTALVSSQSCRDRG